ncbi:putative vacuolar amino acid transporter YPQ3 [Pseudocercospora fuligena]|uniref:Putative vacuolar amino acid transporter YPQ3 n=1 Tax=Pseudocercospora fuligena TaxID=685502 RepID=A0A8H6RPL8_9PEZI|nr:putative vacuolar amino acid transporter YPQ3 [Pseudocercospora fuligena]
MNSWLSTSAFEPHLPDHCAPETDFLLRFSSTFHTCVPTKLAFASNLLGALSIVAWLFAQLPQIYKNWSLQSTSGLSIFFLVEWCLGDLGNLLGALFTHQATWQVAIGCYYVFVDLCLVGQWIWFEKLRHGHPVFRVWRRTKGNGYDSSDSGSMEQVVIEGMPVLSPTNSRTEPRDECESDIAQGHQDATKPPSRPKIIFRTPTFERPSEEKEKGSLSSTPRSNTIHRVGPSSPMPSPSPRTMLFIACLIAMAHASPIKHTSVEGHPLVSGPTATERAGTVLSWMSTVLYLGSRLPQLFKNWRRKSTSGLSPHLFIAAFCGNMFYSSALLTNPCAWEDFGSYSGGGWVGKDGSDRSEWVMAALPFFLGAAGVLGLDASVGVQFLIYGEGPEKLVVVEEEQGRRRWRRVSGWIRGWMPSISEGKGSERRALIERNPESQRGEGYGAL